VHGQGLRIKPFIQDVESFVLIDANGKEKVCSRSENRELFRLSIGGYGLFGIIYSVKLRLVPKQKVERVVEIMSVEDLMPAYERRIRDGFTHTLHTSEGVEYSRQAFRRLIDMAIRRGGSYYLTHHKFATREQVKACYPQFPEFLRLKKQYDPEERFQSDWYRHYKEMFTKV
jgi:FAD/FMN-containing dehydrogenase